MSKLKYTPGPWIPIFGLSSEKIYGIDNGKVNIINTGGISRYRSVEGQANARLISCAPEMLEALIETCNHFCVLDNIESGMNPKEGEAGKIIKIIERATGLTIEEVLKCTE